MPCVFIVGIWGGFMVCLFVRGFGVIGVLLVGGCLCRVVTKICLFRNVTICIFVS